MIEAKIKRHLKKMDSQVWQDPAIPVLGTYPEDVKAGMETDT